MMERRDEKQMVLTEVTFNSVIFTNFPSYVSSADGEVTYSLMDTVVADRVAEDYPDRAEKIVTVDFAELDVKTLTQEAKVELGIKSPFATREEAQAAELEMIADMTKAGFFEN